MNKVARWLLVLAVVLVTVSSCGDLYFGVPEGDNVNVLGRQDNG
jgi:predicted small lipoprotein YifL